MTERPEVVVFANGEGLRLFGILHPPYPDVPQRDTGIIFLSPGVKSRVAPHRLYNKMAEHFAGMGFPVLRFDFFGLGDSEGELPERQLVDLYATVHDGRYVGDTQCAMDWMEQRMGLKRFVLAGLCGGAITGLLAAATDPRARGVLGLGMPVALEGREADASRFMTQGQLEDLGGTYLSKLLKPDAWLRLLTLQTDYRLLVRSVYRRIRGRRLQPATLPVGAAASNLNPRFPAAFFDFLTNRGKLLLVFSGADRLAWEFEEKFAQPYAERIQAISDGYELQTVPHANHILSDPEWRRQAQGMADAWLARYF